ncbi:MAG: hypothetical protein OHK0046_45300 [Anaerolineae bacterium]
MKCLVIAGLLVIGMVSALLVSAQDEGETITVSGHEVQVMPLSVVTESEVQVFDITDTTARVNFVGTIPLACYLVYGTDERFGSVTNDPDMAQAAIIDHNPVLLDLTPDTEYVFRMQGIGEDGVIYVSELYTFRTLPASEEANANLLSPENGASVLEVSSNFGNQPNDGRWGILNAFDGNSATEWSSNGDGDDAYFIVELNGPHRINTIEYWTRAMSDGTAITESFTVTTSSGETFGPFALEEGSVLTTFEVDFVTDVLRFDVETSTGGNTGIIDIAVYGTPASD